MSIDMSRFLFVSIIGLVVFTGSILLQVFLSKQKSKWLGLVLPAIHLTLAFIGSFGLMMYDGQILTILFGFFILSIPAIILLLVYFAVRGKMKGNHNEELDKMNIQDL